MDEEGRREVGLFRYAVVRDAADPALSRAERGGLVRALAQPEHVGRDGRLVRIGRTTLDRWIRAYRGGRSKPTGSKPMAHYGLPDCVLPIERPLVPDEPHVRPQPSGLFKRIFMQ